MFDIGFMELLVIMIIALLVIGPERMPEVARQIGRFMGKMRRFINSVKEEGQVQETIKEVQDAMNIEAEQQQISNISKELQSGLDFEGLDMDQFNRPNFGGSDSAIDAPGGGSQFNKAPSQPAMPQSAQPSKTDTKVEQQPAAEPAPAVNTADAPATQPAPQSAEQGDQAKPTETSKS